MATKTGEKQTPASLLMRFLAVADELEFIGLTVKHKDGSHEVDWSGDVSDCTLAAGMFEHANEVALATLDDEEE